MAARDAHLADLFEQVISSPPDQRAELIAASGDEDPSLAHDLESLLSAHDSADFYFEQFSRDVLSPAISAAGLDEVSRDSDLLNRLSEAVGTAYSIEREIGGGGMSRVFIATEVRLGRKVVIKTLPQAVPLTVSADRFRHEIQVAARLQNSHIVPVLTTGGVDGLLYYVMPYVEGETLRGRLSRAGPLPVEDAIAIWRDVLDALAAAHLAGIVHRDVKPENILLSGRNALVADFGIARAVEASTEGAETTAPAALVGTPAYMAPEQMLDESSGDHRIDIYAAGLVMYEMLAGYGPFSGMSVAETIDAQRTRVPPSLSRHDLPAPIASLVKQCIEKDPSARPSSVESMLEQLDRAKIDQPRKRNRRSVVIASVILAAVGLAGVGAFALLGKPAANAGSPLGTIASAAEPSLLVLPLANLSRDSADVSLSDGMTAELIGRLSANSNIRVIPGASLVAGRSAHRDPRAIADSLGVTGILEGSMAKAGSRLRLQLHLISVRDGSIRWTETFNRDMRDVFAVQDEISERVSSELDAGYAVTAGR